RSELGPSGSSAGGRWLTLEVRRNRSAAAETTTSAKGLAPPRTQPPPLRHSIAHRCCWLLRGSDRYRLLDCRTSLPGSSLLRPSRDQTPPACNGSAPAQNCLDSIPNSETSSSACPLVPECALVCRMECHPPTALQYAQELERN